jgi:hypothetical protein
MIDDVVSSRRKIRMEKADREGLGPTMSELSTHPIMCMTS